MQNDVYMTHMCVYIYIYTYICACVCVCVCMYMPSLAYLDWTPIAWLTAGTDTAGAAGNAETAGAGAAGAGAEASDESDIVSCMYLYIYIDTYLCHKSVHIYDMYIYIYTT